MYKITHDLLRGPACDGICTSDFNSFYADHQFRMLNSDGEVWFEGVSDVIWSAEPLEKLGKLYGCVEIQYREDNLWLTA